MEKKLRRRHDAHVRANGVCTEHSALFDATPGGQKTRAALGTQVGDVERLLTLQKRSVQDRRTATERCRLSRRTLRAAAKAVVKIGKIANLDDAMVAALQLPDRGSDDDLLAESRALLDLISSHADALVAEGLPPDVLQHLTDAVQAFAAARDAQSGSRERFSGASEAIREMLDKADKTVDALEEIVVHTPGGQPEVLKKLRMARRIGPRMTEPAPTPAPTPPPPPAPTDKAA